MPEKKPVPPPAPRNRHERLKRASEERKARPWLPRPLPLLDGQWTVFSPGRKLTFEIVGDHHAGAIDKPAHTVTGSLAVVHWRSKTTGVTGHGKAIAVDLAQAWADDGNKQHPDMEYWLVPITSEYVPGDVADGDVVVVPDANGSPKLRPYQAHAVQEALNSGGIVTSGLMRRGGFTRRTGPSDPGPASFDHKL